MKSSLIVLKCHFSKASSRLITAKKGRLLWTSGVKETTSVPRDLCDPVEILADVSPDRTDEKGVTENQTPAASSAALPAWHRAISCTREPDAALTSSQTRERFSAFSCHKTISCRLVGYKGLYCTCDSLPTCRADQGIDSCPRSLSQRAPPGEARPVSATEAVPLNNTV